MSAVVESGVTHLPERDAVARPAGATPGGIAGLSPAHHRTTRAVEEDMRRQVAAAAAARRRAAEHPQGWWFQ